jgi:hypothetical protein
MPLKKKNKYLENGSQSILKSCFLTCNLSYEFLKVSHNQEVYICFPRKTRINFVAIFCYA